MTQVDRPVLKHLQEIFKGQVDADVIELVLTECQNKVEDAVMQLLTLSEVTKDSSNSDVPSSVRNLDDLEPIDVPVSNVQRQEHCPVYDCITKNPSDTPHSESTRSGNFKKNTDQDKNLLPNSTSSLRGKHCSDISETELLAVTSNASLTCSSVQLQSESEDALQGNSDISKAIDIQDTKLIHMQTDGKFDIARNTDSNTSDNNTSGHETKHNPFPRWTFLNTHEFNNSSLRSSNQNLPFQNGGFARYPFGSNFLSTQTFNGQHVQPQNFRNNLRLRFVPQERFVMRPQQSFSMRGHQGNRAIPQHRPVVGNYQQLDSKKEPFKRSFHKYTTDGYPQTGKQGRFATHSKNLVVLRGLPGSGKSTLARCLAARGGVILSTDDYFMKGGRYYFNPLELSTAHEWNQTRAKRFMEGGITPVIIDNTNVQAWEMKPYISVGLRYGYKVDIKEPNTKWKWNIRELERRNTHGVDRKTLQNMYERYEKNVTVGTIMKSVRPTMEIVKTDNGKKECKQHDPNCQTNSDKKDQHSASETVNNIVSDDGSKAKRPLTFEKNVPSPRFSKTCDSSKSCSSGEKLDGFEDETPQLETSTIESSTTGQIQRGVVHVSELESPCVEVEDADKQRILSNPIIDEFPRNENVGDQSDDLCRKESDKSVSETVPSSDITDGKICTENSGHLHSKKMVEYVQTGVSPESDEKCRGDAVFLGEEESHVCLHDNSCSAQSGEGCDEKAKKEVGHVRSPSTASPTEPSSPEDNNCLSQDVADAETRDNQAALSIPRVQQIPDGQIEHRAELKCAETIERDKTGTDMVENSVAPDADESLVTNNELFSGKTMKEDGEDKIDRDAETVKTPPRETAVITRVDSPKKDLQETGEVLNVADGKTYCSVENTGTEVDSDNSASPDSLNFLQDCFPHVRVSLLQTFLNRCHGDVVRTVDCLFQYNEDGGKENTSDDDDVESHKEATWETIGNIPQDSSLTLLNGPVNLGENAVSDETKDPENIAGRDLNSQIRNNNTGKSNSIDPLPATPCSSNGLQDFSCSPLHLTLDPALALQLLEIFGSFSGISAKDTLTEDLLSVRIDQDFAKLLYTKWRKTVQANKKSMSSEARKFKQTKVTPNPPTPGSNSKRRSKTPLREFYLPDDVHYTPPKHVTPCEPVSLKEIMDEQLAIHVSQSEQEVDKSWKEENMDLSTKLKRSRLHGMFPGIDVVSLNEIFEANNYNFDKTVLQVQSSCGLPIAGNSSQSDDFQSPTFNKVESIGGNQLAFQTETDSGAEYQSLDDPTYKDFRAEAEAHFKLRDECIKKAALAYSRKQGELARIYAEQARAHGEKIKESNRWAAEKILEIRVNDLKNSNTLDLHELHVGEALHVLETVLEKRKQELRSPNRKSPSFVQVVTGRGSHSRDGKARIKPAVVEYIKRNGYRFEELNLGLYRVYLN